MAGKIFVNIACMIFFILPLSYEALSFKRTRFKLVENLQESQKGETVRLEELRQYLTTFGYLDSSRKSINTVHTDVGDSNFDEVLESAIKTYQLNYNLKPTGILDTETVKKMKMPRCGVPDIINGTNTMQAAKKRKHHHHDSTTLHTVAHYAFFPRSPRWPDSKTHLTYSFLPGTRVDLLSPVCGRAFTRWSSVSKFTFEEIQDIQAADITIGFFSGDHGDGYPFDGPGKKLAHAFPPPDGRFHYDADENWSTDLTAGTYDLQNTALHEIGHLLGLGHSNDEGAIMYPSTTTGVRNDLNQDDIEGIRALYNL